MTKKCPIKSCVNPVSPDTGRGVICSSHGEEFLKRITMQRCGFCDQPTPEGERKMCDKCYHDAVVHHMLQCTSGVN